MNLVIDKILGDVLLHDHPEVILSQLDIITLSSDISELTSTISGKLNISDFNSYSGSVSGEFEALDSVNIDYSPINYTATTPDISGNLNGIDLQISIIDGSILSLSAGLTGLTFEKYDSVYNTVSANSGNWDSSTKLNIIDFNSYSGSVNESLTAINAELAAISGEFSTGDLVDINYSASNYISTTGNISGHLNGLDNRAFVWNATTVTVTSILATTGTMIANATSGKLNISDFNSYSSSVLNTTNTLSSKLNTSDFNSYSGNVLNTTNTLSSYETIINHTNSLTAKLNVTDFEAYSGDVSGTFIAGDMLTIDYTNINYTATDLTLSGHLNGIDLAVGSLSTTISAQTFMTYGLSADRPVDPITGFMYFDMTYGMPVWKGPTGWVNATGASA